MPSSYVNNLRLEEMATGEKSGTWGTITNTNLELIGEALGYGTEDLASDADTTITMQDATSDGVRAMYLKITSSVSLTTTRTITLAPNTVSKVWIIENATTGSQSITISQGSGSNVTIGSGASKLLYTDGAGAAGAVNEVALLSTTGGTMTGDLDFNDNVKAVFGAGSDLQIYHNGTNSYIDDTGTGALFIRSDEVRMNKYTGEYMLRAFADSSVQLYYDNAQKLATTATGVDVTGAVVSDSLTVDTTTLVVDATNNRVGIGTASPTEELHIKASVPTIKIEDTADSTYFAELLQSGLSLYIDSDVIRIRDRSNNEKVRFDNANGRVGIGTSSPVKALTISGASNGNITTLTDGATITPDLDDSDMFTVTLGGNRTLANPSNIDAGQTGSIFIVQDGTGSRTLAFGSYWDFAGGTAPTLSTTASAVDRIDFIVRSSTSIHAVFTANYS